MKHPNSGPRNGPQSESLTSALPSEPTSTPPGPAAPKIKTRPRTRTRLRSKAASAAAQKLRRDKPARQTSTIQNSAASLARHGKIARLPRKVRDELNRRLDEGWAGPRLLRWLNGLPETKQILREHFDGQPISQQNLSQWRLGGFRDWLLQQEVRVAMEDFAANNQDLEQKMGFEFTDKLALWMCMRYALMTRHLERMNPLESWKPIREMCRDVVALRRGDFKLREQRLKEERQKKLTEEDHRKWVSAPGRLERLYYEKTHDEKVRKKIEREKQARLDEIFGMTPKPDPDEEQETESAQPQTGQKGGGEVPRNSPATTAPCASEKTKFHKVEQSEMPAAAETPPRSAETPNTKNQTPTEAQPVGPVGQNPATPVTNTTAAPSPPQKPPLEQSSLTDADLEKFIDQCECGWKGKVRAEECPRCHISANMHQSYCVCHKVWEYKHYSQQIEQLKRERAAMTRVLSPKQVP